VPPPLQFELTSSCAILLSEASFFSFFRTPYFLPLFMAVRLDAPSPCRCAGRVSIWRAGFPQADTRFCFFLGPRLTVPVTVLSSVATGFTTRIRFWCRQERQDQVKSRTRFSKSSVLDAFSGSVNPDIDRFLMRFTISRSSFAIPGEVIARGPFQTSGLLSTSPFFLTQPQ